MKEYTLKKFFTESEISEKEIKTNIKNLDFNPEILLNNK